jgi:hypothetical protein
MGAKVYGAAMTVAPDGTVKAIAPLAFRAGSGGASLIPRFRKPASPFGYSSSSPDVIRLVAMMYVRLPLSLRNVEGLLAERGMDVCHETVRFS